MAATGCADVPSVPIDCASIARIWASPGSRGEGRGGNDGGGVATETAEKASAARAVARVLVLRTAEAKEKAWISFQREMC